MVYLTDADAEPFVVSNTDNFNGTAESPGTGDITGSNPDFVGTITHGSITPSVDINLQSSSPAIDAGSSSFTIDLSGSARDSNSDIGALEFAAGYANIIIGVAAGSLGKIIGVTKANASKVIGTWTDFRAIIGNLIILKTTYYEKVFKECSNV